MLEPGGVGLEVAVSGGDARRSGERREAVHRYGERKLVVGGGDNYSLGTKWIGSEKYSSTAHPNAFVGRVGKFHTGVKTRVFFIFFS